MNEQLAAIRRIRPAIDATTAGPAAPRQLEISAGPLEQRVMAVQQPISPTTPSPQSGSPNASGSEEAEPRADEGWRRQLIHALKDLDRQGLRLDAPSVADETPEPVPIPLPDERIEPPRIIARPEPVATSDAPAPDICAREARPSRPVASVSPVVHMPQPPAKRHRAQRATGNATRRWSVPLTRHRAVHVAGVLALASLVSSNPLHSAIPPEPRANLAAFSIGLGNLRKEGARLLAAERTIEHAVTRAATSPSLRFTADPILEMTPQLVGAGQAAGGTPAAANAPPTQSQPDTLDRQGLQTLIASLPDQTTAREPAHSAPDTPSTPSRETAPPVKKKASIARTAPEPASTIPPSEEPLVRIAPEAEDLDAAEAGDGEVRPSTRQARRKATKSPRKIASARKRPPLQGERRMSVGAKPVQPTTIVQSSGLFGYIGSLIRPEPRLWSDPSVARP